MDFQYNLAQWLLFFYIYCFFGWCIESAYVSIHKEEVCKPGVYAGAVSAFVWFRGGYDVVVTIPVRDSLVLTYIFGAIGADNFGVYYRGVAWKRCSR